MRHAWGREEKADGKGRMTCGWGGEKEGDGKGRIEYGWGGENVKNRGE